MILSGFLVQGLHMSLDVSSKCPFPRNDSKTFSLTSENNMCESGNPNSSVDHLDSQFTVSIYKNNRQSCTLPNKLQIGH